MIKRKLTSRKLWASIANFISMILIFFNYSQNEVTQIAALVMAGGGVIAYIIGEGLADSSTTYEACETLPIIDDSTEE